MPRRAAVFAVILLVALPALAFGCDGGGSGSDGTLEASQTPTIEEATDIPATATAAPDIRQQDLSSQPALRAFMETAGGEIASDGISYVDLTNDGIEEAIVPVSSGGTAGDIAIFIFGYGPTGLAELLRVQPDGRSVRAEVIDGEVRVTEPIFAPGDPLGIPSQLRHRFYRWDGTTLVLDREELE